MSLGMRSEEIPSAIKLRTHWASTSRKTKTIKNLNIYIEQKTS